MGCMQLVRCSSPSLTQSMTYNGVVDIDQDARVCRAISAGEGDERTRSPTASASDRDLAAGDVELRPSLALRHVQPDVLYAEEIIATGGCCRDFEGHCCVAFEQAVSPPS